MPPSSTEPSYTAEQFAAKHGITRRTLRYYLAKRILPAPEPRGGSTRYGALQDAVVSAIRVLSQRGMTLDEIRKRLRGLSLAQIRALVPPPPAELPELGDASAIAAPVGDPWSRVLLVPGLELHVAASAPPAVRRLAGQIRDHFRMPT